MPVLGVLDFLGVGAVVSLGPWVLGVLGVLWSLVSFGPLGSLGSFGSLRSLGPSGRVRVLGTGFWAEARTKCKSVKV